MDGSTVVADMPFYSASESVKPGQIYVFNPKRVRPLPDQPRTKFLGIKELAQSIHDEGQKVPGTVEVVHGPDAVHYDAQLIAGERRLRACIMANRQFRAYTVVVPNEIERYKMALIDNFHRESLSALGVARSLKKILDLEMSGGKVKQAAVVAIASYCTKSPTWVLQHLNLMSLTPEVQALLDTDEETGINFQTAQHIARFEPEAQNALVQELAGKRPVEARRIVYAKIRAGKGFRGRARKLSSTTFVNFIEELEHRFGVYLDMKKPELIRLLRGEIPFEERRRTIAKIRELQDALRTFGEILAPPVLK